MAIAFRAAGARLKADVSATGPSLSVALPTGHATGDFLLLFIVTDSNSNTTVDPSGWSRIYNIWPATATRSPYYAPPRLRIYYRTDTGSLGSSVPLVFSGSPWPDGSPYVIAFTAAYTGVDPAAPFDQRTGSTSFSTNAALASPAVTTTAANDWLLSFRASSSDTLPARTYTNSVAADAERVDDHDTSGELSCALYDSNAALATGAQTVRTITASGVCDYGSCMVSIALKSPAPSGSTTAAPGDADVAASAFNASVQSQDGPWDSCDDAGRPVYRFDIDWNVDGSFASSTAQGSILATDTFARTVSSGWGSADTGQAWTVGSTAANFSVTPGTGLHSLTSLNVSRFATLPLNVADVDLSVDVSTAVLASGGSIYSYLAARYLDSSNFYCARMQMTSGQAVVLTLRKRLGGTETELTAVTAPLTHTAGTAYTVRLRLVGQSLWAKVWATGTPEPDWMITTVDSGLTQAASAGVRSLLGTDITNTLPVAVAFDNFRASAALDPDDVTEDVVSDISITYGRDQERQLSPAAVGSAAFSLNNTARQYSPENTESPLYGSLDPARAMQALVVWSGQTYPLFRGRIDDFTVKADFGDRSVDLSFLDGMNDLSGNLLSTGVYTSMRTGALINTVLDEAGWTGGRDIDPGATVVSYWWADGTDALSAISDLVHSEGPPAVAYVAPDGTFIFRDRHHRMLRQESLTPQATFHAGALGDCTDEGVPQGALSLARPFTYAHGWRDIVNAVTFTIAERAPTTGLQQVWQDQSTYTLGIGQSLDLTVSSSDPFMNAVAPVAGTDITAAGPGVVGVLLSRTSGASARLTLQAIGGAVTVSFVQVRAQLLAVQQTVRVSLTDPGSVARHGERAYPNEAPWAGAEDARAIADMVLLNYAERRPTVQLRLVSSDPAHFAQVLRRTVSDRVRVVNDEMRLDDDFFVERVTHTVQRTGALGRPPVHAVVLGCERDLDVNPTPFTFDVRGLGFDHGVFDPLQADDASQVFIFDDPVQGLFDTGEFGT